MNRQELKDLDIELYTRLTGKSLCKSRYVKHMWSAWAQSFDCEEHGTMGCESLESLPHYTSTWDGIRALNGLARISHIEGHHGPILLHMLRACANGRYEAQFCSDFLYGPAVRHDDAPVAVGLALKEMLDGKVG